MPLSIRDPKTEAAVRRLAKLKNKPLTETVLDAVEKELERSRREIPLAERLAVIAADLGRHPKSGLKADKEFFDWLSGDED